MLNKVILVGKVFEEPELRYFKDNTVITVIKLVTNDIINGIKQNNWHRIIVNKKSKNEFKKNMKLIVIGKIKTRRWLDNKNKYNYITEIISDDIKIIDENKERYENNYIENITENEIEQNEKEIIEQDLNSTSNENISNIEENDKEKNNYKEYYYDEEEI